MGDLCLQNLVKCLDELVKASQAFLAYMLVRLSACIGGTASLSEMPLLWQLLTIEIPGESGLVSVRLLLLNPKCANALSLVSAFLAYHSAKHVGRLSSDRLKVVIESACSHALGSANRAPNAALNKHNRDAGATPVHVTRVLVSPYVPRTLPLAPPEEILPSHRAM